MKEYVIRSTSGTETCIVADTMSVDMLHNKARFSRKWGYTENTGDYCNYYHKTDITELPLNGIEFIGVIRYDVMVYGELDIIYHSREGGDTHD